MWISLREEVWSYNMSSEMNTFQYDGREKRQSELKFLYIINYGCGSKGLGTTEFTKKG